MKYSPFHTYFFIFVLSVGLVSCSEEESGTTTNEFQITRAEILSPMGGSISIKGTKSIHLKEVSASDLLVIEANSPGRLESSWNCTDGRKTFQQDSSRKLNGRHSLTSFLSKKIISNSVGSKIYCNVELHAFDTSGSQNFTEINDLAIHIPEQQEIDLYYSNTRVSEHIPKRLYLSTQFEKLLLETNTKRIQLSCDSTQTSLENRGSGLLLADFYRRVRFDRIVDSRQSCRFWGYDSSGFLKGYSLEFSMDFNAKFLQVGPIRHAPDLNYINPWKPINPDLALFTINVHNPNKFPIEFEFEYADRKELVLAPATRIGGQLNLRHEYRNKIYVYDSKNQPVTRLKLHPNQTEELQFFTNLGHNCKFRASSSVIGVKEHGTFIYTNRGWPVRFILEDGSKSNAREYIFKDYMQWFVNIKKPEGGPEFSKTKVVKACETKTK